MNFDALDLNLLRVLDALLVERSVSRAAARLRLSQPATSSALNRLRHAFKDPLFVRSREGMAPTARALALQGALTASLRQLQSALVEPAPFDPVTARHTFFVAASDHAQLVVLPALMARWAAFKGLRLRVVPLPRDFPLGELERGEVDVVMGVFDLAPGDRAPKGLKRQLLVSERFVLVGRTGNPVLKHPEKLDLQWPQMHVAPRGGVEGAFDRRVKLKRNVVLFTPHYLVAPWVLESTDLVAALPERIAARFVESFSTLSAVPLPLATDAALRLHQLWHPRRHDEPTHHWLRGELLAAAKLARTPTQTR